MNLKKSRLKQIIFLVLSGIFFSGLFTECSSGKKALEHGNYYEASLKAINRLRSKPGSKNATRTLKQSYPYAVEYFEKQANAAMALNDPFKYSKIVGYYEQLNQLALEIERCPGAKTIIPNPKTYYEELSKARELGAEEQYELGVVEMDKNTRANAKQAYYHFVAADKMVKNYKNTSELIPQAKYFATLKVLLEQIPVSGTENELSSIFFYNEIMENLRKNSATEFVRFINTTEMEMENMEPDQLLRMHFQEFVMGQTYDKETIREVSKDSVVVGTVTLDDGTTLNAYNTVKAKVKVLHRELTSKGLLNVIIIENYNGQAISQKKFPGQYTWITEWGTYTGDERALSKEDAKLTKLQGENPPPPQHLFVEFSKPIYIQTVSYLKNFYSKY